MAHLKDLLVNGDAKVLGEIHSPKIEGSISMGRTVDNDIGVSSVALGISCTASGEASHAEGSYSDASGNSSHAEGCGTIASGDQSHAEGYVTTASGDYSHAEGYVTTASGYASHAEGGSNTSATGSYAHAEGENTHASGDWSHTEGQSSRASSSFAHAEGWGTVASGSASHAEGYGTIATRYAQHVQGAHNIEDVNSNYLHIVGNGLSEDVPSNAHTLDWNGDAWFKGNVYVGSTSGTNKDSGSKKLATTDVVTTSTAGLMSAADKTKLDGIAAQANKITIDTALSTSSTNPVQNKVVNTALSNKLSLSGGNISGHVYLTGAQANSSTGNTSQIVFGTSSNNHIAISSNDNALVINPTSSTTTNQIVLYLDKASLFPSGISGNVTGNLTGTASKATADASGNTITSTYAKLASPTFTGTPKAPTAAAGTNTTQIATTAFVTTAVSSKQNKITGTAGDFVVIGSDGNVTTKTIAVQTYYSGEVDPPSTLGEDGDLYFVTG